MARWNKRGKDEKTKHARQIRNESKGKESKQCGAKWRKGNAEQ